jgi:PIN domain nuclease of toxin-antitoxin system
LPANFSGDPGDRLIAATALAERIAVVSAGAKIPIVSVEFSPVLTW